MKLDTSKLIKTAFFSAPIFAVYGITPMYLISDASLDLYFAGVSFLTVIVLIMWSINIGAALYFPFEQNKMRYAASFLGLCIVISTAIVIRPYVFQVELPEKGEGVFPFLTGFSINFIILIILNGLILKDRKDEADREIQDLKIKNMEARQSLLMQQFQPHFVFNALSTLKSLGRSAPDKAEEYLLKLSDFLRFSIQTRNRFIVSLEEEWNFSREYLEMQQIRFGDALQCTFIEESPGLGKQIPVFAIQSLLENAIKHNGFSEEKPLKIEVRADAERVSVRNNRIPKLVLQSSKTGLDSLNQRFKLTVGEMIKIQETDSFFEVILPLCADEPLSDQSGIALNTAV